MTRRLAASVVSLMLLCACSGKTAASYSGTSALAHALNSNGVACTGMEATSGAPATEGAAASMKDRVKPLVDAAATCSHGKTRLLLFTFKNRDLRDRWLTLGKLYGSVVVGPNWTVSTHSDQLAKQIGSAIGGEVQ